MANFYSSSNKISTISILLLLVIVKDFFDKKNKLYYILGHKIPL